MTALRRRSPKTGMDGKPCDSRPANTLCMRGRSEGHLYGYGYGEIVQPAKELRLHAAAGGTHKLGRRPEGLLRRGDDNGPLPANARPAKPTQSPCNSNLEI